MKKSAVIFIMSILCGYAAQAQTFVKGDLVGNLGLGIGSSIYSSGYTNRLPATSISMEYCIKDNLFDDKSSIGVGGYLGFASARSIEINNTYYKSSSVIIGARGSFHYQFVDKLDTYGTLMLGYNVRGGKWVGNGDYGGYSDVSPLNLSIGVGARYYFNDKFAVFSELGWGIATLNVGVSYKF